MPGEPQVRETVYHLFVRLWEHMDSSGWRLEVRECQGTHRATRVYETEEDARSVLQAIYQLADQSPPLPTREPDRLEKGRWRVFTYERI
jgi:hypothetical protein